MPLPVQTNRNNAGRRFGLFWPYDSLLEGFASLSAERFAMPRIEVLERNHELVVRADLPGVDPKDIEVVVDEDMLVLSGHRESERSEERTGYYLSERQFGTFQRTVSFPTAVDASRAKARLKNGVLEVTIPIQGEREQTRGRKLDIETA